MNRDQKTVAAGALSGIAAMLLSTWLLYTVLPAPAGVTDQPDAVLYALRWLPLTALPLLAMIVSVGNARAMGPAIDPTLGNEDQAMRINIRVADNTLQQFALFVAGLLPLSFALASAPFVAVSLLLTTRALHFNSPKALGWTLTCANLIAVAWPMPWPAPVMIATLSLRRMASFRYAQRPSERRRPNGRNLPDIDAAHKARHGPRTGRFGAKCCAGSMDCVIEAPGGKGPSYAAMRHPRNRR